MNWYIISLKRFTDFRGRSRRKEYWMFTVFNIIFSFLAIYLDKAFGIAFGSGYGPIYILYFLATLIPAIAVGVRRLHDVGKSGWLLLIALIPLFGALVLLILFCTNSQSGENQWGPNPKETNTDPSDLV